jgi:collagenase-like PrtC family protease
VDKVIFVAGSGSSTGKDKTEKVDKEGAEKSVELAKKHGIKKYVMLTRRPGSSKSTKPYTYLKELYKANSPATIWNDTGRSSSPRM